MSIEARAYQNQLWFDKISRLLQSKRKAAVVIVSRCAIANGGIDDVPQPSAASCLISRAGARIEAMTIAVNAKEHHIRSFVENILRAVAVMHIPIHNQDSAQAVSVNRMPGRER